MAERLTRPLLFFGIKHCGKSTLGRLTAEHFGVKFVDTDLELESRFQMLNGCPLPTRDIFRELGEEGFRRFEAETVEALAAQQKIVLDKRKIVLDEPIKTTGVYTVRCKLGYEISGELRVEVKEA